MILFHTKRFGLNQEEFIFVYVYNSCKKCALPTSGTRYVAISYLWATVRQQECCLHTSRNLWTWFMKTGNLAKGG